jgi:hypothetical protein
VPRPTFPIAGLPPKRGKRGSQVDPLINEMADNAKRGLATQVERALLPKLRMRCWRLRFKYQERVDPHNPELAWAWVEVKAP